MKKKLLISLPIALVALVVVYLFGVSTLQANGYKSSAKSAQLALSGSVGKAITAARQNAYLDSTVNVIEAKNAVKISKDAAGELESKIKNNEKKLADFSELPLVVGVNQAYKEVLDVKALEGQYVKVSKEYLVELEAVNLYNEKLLPVFEIMDKMDVIAADMENAESVDEVTNALDKLVAELDKAIKLATQLKPAESQKEMHNSDVKDIKYLAYLVKQMKAAIVAEDMNKFIAAGEAFDKKEAAMEKVSKAQGITFVEKSKLAKLGDKLNNISKQIDIKTANW